MIKGNTGGLAKLLGMDKETSPEMFEDFEMHDSLQFNTRSEVLAHLYAHKEAGHIVPNYAIESLQSELEKHGETLEYLNDGIPLIDIGEIDDTDSSDDIGE